MKLANIPLKIIVIGCCLIFWLSNGKAQNLESIDKKDLVNASGSISLNQIFYDARGIDNRRDPYSYFLSANLSMDIAGMALPFSFMLSNQNNNFQQPFNQFSINPTYRSVTAHLGYNSLTYSPYTLNGHIFLGAGVDLQPAKSPFQFSAMYGRLNKAVEPDTLNPNAAPPFYKRMGYGFKAGYSKDRDFLHLILFHAEDKINSISFVPDSLALLPEENLVVSLQGGKSLGSRLFFTTEWASSAITKDVRANEGSVDNNFVFSLFSPIFSHRNSTSYYNAFKSNLSYQSNFFTAGIGYERVDPGYKTHGAYFFNNDLENVTTNIAARLLQGKINVSSNFGIQRNNLENKELSQMERVVGAVNISYNVNNKFSFNTSYSNFTTFTNIRSQFEDINQLTPYNNLDTLNFTQISQTATFNSNYVFGDGSANRQFLNVNLSFQDASDKRSDVDQNTGSRFYNLNATYNLAFLQTNLSFTAGFNANRSESGPIESTTLGPTVAVTKAFPEKKLRGTLSSSLNNSYDNDELINRILNVRLLGSYRVHKKQNLNLSLIMVNRKSNTQGAPTFTEFTGTLGYSYHF